MLYDLFLYFMYLYSDFPGTQIGIRTVATMALCGYRIADARWKPSGYTDGHTMWPRQLAMRGVNLATN